MLYVILVLSIFIREIRLINTIMHALEEALNIARTRESWVKSRGYVSSVYNVNGHGGTAEGNLACSIQTNTPTVQ